MSILEGNRMRFKGNYCALAVSASLSNLYRKGKRGDTKKQDKKPSFMRVYVTTFKWRHQYSLNLGILLLPFCRELWVYDCS